MHGAEQVAGHAAPAACALAFMPGPTTGASLQQRGAHQSLKIVMVIGQEAVHDQAAHAVGDHINPAAVVCGLYGLQLGNEQLSVRGVGLPEVVPEAKQVCAAGQSWGSCTD